MPAKHHIKAVATLERFRRVGKFGSVDWREDCVRCSNCVKPRCVYDAYKKEAACNRDPETSVIPLYECRGCLSCVQGCTKGILAITANPEYLAMGDEYWRPDILATTWNQADSGRIPVSGAGYRGRFHGPGFDGIWTDMSEIVRPTRDGIHGREYTSTSVDIGRKPMRLSFSSDGQLTGETTSLIDVPIPLILDVWIVISSAHFPSPAMSDIDITSTTRAYTPLSIELSLYPAPPPPRSTTANPTANATPIWPVT